MPAHPEDQSCILAVPAASAMPPEKRPRLSVILVWHEHPHPAHVRSVPSSPSGRTGTKDACHRITALSALVFLPDDGKKQGARAVHDGNVGQLPIAIVRY